MKKIWKIVSAFSLIAVLLGAILVGVGFLTGGSQDRLYNALNSNNRMEAFEEIYSEDIAPLLDGITSVFN